MRHSFFGGVTPAPNKENTRRKPIARPENYPERVVLPVLMCADDTAEPLVQVGDPVTVGQPVACGTAGITGKFCPECGQPRPADDGGWTCSCGTVNTGKFCQNCGSKKPAGVPQYKCDKCGWQPEDPTKAPRFCPECGDPFDNGDII